MTDSTLGIMVLIIFTIINIIIIMIINSIQSESVITMILILIATMKITVVNGLLLDQILCKWLTMVMKLVFTLL